VFAEDCFSHVLCAHHARLVEDMRARLAHVLWIGGGPQAGKTTLSRLLAGKWDLKIYNLDWHAVREHAGRPGAAVTEFQRLSMDERWAVPSADQLLERSVTIWQDGFTLVLDDLLALPDSRSIIAEGPGAFPWCVAPLLSSAQQAIFLVPTPERREVVATRRWGSGQRERFPGIAERERALTNIRARDALLDARIVSSCAELGLRCERLDGSLDLDASLALVEDHFRDHLPTTPNV
jgi:cytidylate kinase